MFFVPGLILADCQKNAVIPPWLSPSTFFPLAGINVRAYFHRGRVHRQSHRTKGPEFPNLFGRSDARAFFFFSPALSLSTLFLWERRAFPFLFFFSTFPLLSLRVFFLSLSLFSHRNTFSGFTWFSHKFFLASQVWDRYFLRQVRVGGEVVAAGFYLEHSKRLHFYVDFFLPHIPGSAQPRGVTWI